MFIDYDSINQPISRDLVFSFYGLKDSHYEIARLILDFKDTDYNERIKVNSLNKIEELPQPDDIQITNPGRFNLEWVKKTTDKRPSVLTLLYDAKNKPSNISWTEFENTICTDIYKARKSDCYQFMTIHVFILSPNSNFSLDSVTDERDKPYSVKKQIDTKIIYFTSIEVIKLTAKKLQNMYFKNSIQYYKQVKKNLKIKKTNLYLDDYDGHVKIDLKLAIVSLIKNRRSSSKYFEEAFYQFKQMKNNIKNINNTNYNNKEYYLESKTIASFIFRRLVLLKHNNIDYLKQIFNSYIQDFINDGYYKKEVKHDINTNTKIVLEDITYIAEHYWLAVELEFFGNLVKQKMDENGSSYYNITFFGEGFPGFYFLKAGYAYNRLINSLKLRSYTKYEPKFDIRKLNVKSSIYLGKQPSYILFIDPLNPKEIPFDEELHMRLFVEKYNLNIDDTFSKLCKVIGEAQGVYHDVLTKQTRNDKGSINFSSNLAFNHLLIKFISDNNLPRERLSGIYRHCLLSKDLDNFPSLKLKLLEDFNSIVEDPDTQISNLLQIADLRKLTSREEATFHHILFNETIHQKFILNKHYESNNIVNFEIELVNNTPFIHDIGEFRIKVKTSLEKIKINRMKLFFSNPERNFTKELGKKFALTSSLTNSNNNSNSNEDLEYCDLLDFSHKLFVRESDKNLKLLNITIDLSCKEGSTVVIDVILPQKDSSRILQVKSTSSKAIKFDFDNDIKGHINQNLVFNFNYKKLNSHINIDNVNLKFYIKTEEEINSARKEKKNSSNLVNNINSSNVTILNNNFNAQHANGNKKKTSKVFSTSSGLMNSAILANKSHLLKSYSMINNSVTFSNSNKKNIFDNNNDGSLEGNVYASQIFPVAEETIANEANDINEVNTDNINAQSHSPSQPRRNSFDESSMLNNKEIKLSEDIEDKVNNKNNTNNKDNMDDMISNIRKRSLSHNLNDFHEKTIVGNEAEEQERKENEAYNNDQNGDDDNNNNDNDNDESNKKEEVGITETSDETDKEVKSKEIEITKTGLSNLDSDVLKCFLEDKEGINDLNKVTSSFNKNNDLSENKDDNPKVDIDALIENINKNSNLSSNEKKLKVVKINSLNHLAETNLKNSVSQYSENKSNNNSSSNLTNVNLNNNNINDEIFESAISIPASNSNINSNTNINKNIEASNVDPDKNYINASNIYLDSFNTNIEATQVNATMQNNTNKKTSTFNTNMNMNSNIPQLKDLNKQLIENNNYNYLSQTENLYYFYYINEENLFIENETINYNIQRIEDNGAFNCFIKFTKPGNHKLVIKVQYRLTRENLESDSITVCFMDEVDLVISDLFTLKQEIPLQAYLSQDKKKYYPFNSNIKVDIELTNRASSQIFLHKVLFEGYNDYITINSKIDKLLSIEPIDLAINDEMIIPIVVKYNNNKKRDDISNNSIGSSNEISNPNNSNNNINNTSSLTYIPGKSESHSPGWIKILWREQLMNTYIENNLSKIQDLNDLYNELVIPLDKIDFKSPEINLGLEINKDIFFNEGNEMNITIENLTKAVKRVHFLIDNSHNILINGITKKKFVIAPYRKEVIRVLIVPLVTGNVKIPVFKIIECIYVTDQNKNLEEKKICSLYYYPETFRSIVRETSDN